MAHALGDTVYIRSYSIWYNDADVREGRIVKISPTGQLTVDMPTMHGTGRETMRFKNGREIGARYHAASLIEKDRYDLLVVQSNRRRASRRFEQMLSSACAPTKAAALGVIEKLTALASKYPEDEA